MRVAEPLYCTRPPAGGSFAPVRANPASAKEEEWTRVPFSQSVSQSHRQVTYSSIFRLVLPVVPGATPMMSSRWGSTPAAIMANLRQSAAVQPDQPNMVEFTFRGDKQNRQGKKSWTCS